MPSVAPLVGAWIEIYIAEEPVFDGSVAPLVGAWIEITDDYITKMTGRSLLSWERGLKSIRSRHHDGRKGRSSRGSVD